MTGALTDLRLMIDSLDPVDYDLNSVLGMLCDRMQAPLEASRLTREAFSRDLAIDRSAITSTGTEVTVCSMSDGSLRYCPPQERVTHVGTAPASGSDTSTPAAPSGPGWLDALETGTVDHSWVNSYLLALVSYYIYSDALGQPAGAEANFRSLMESWGVDEVRIINVPDRHLRVAVMRTTIG